MNKWITKNSKVWGILLAAVVVIGFLGVWQRYQYKENALEKTLVNPPRKEEAYRDTFYEDQLTEKEKAAYDTVKDALEESRGGEILLPEALNGKEFTRVHNALDCGETDYFYGMVGIPMTADNQNLSYGNKNILEVADSVIEKCVLFLYQSQGINENGEMDENGYVTNFEELKGPLAANDPVRQAEVEKIREEAEAILSKVAEDMPKEYGTKEAIDYFLKWMDENLIYEDSNNQATKIETMSELFPERFYKGHRVCVVEKKAFAEGYARVLTNLCSRVGIASHMVMGVWSSGMFGTKQFPYTLTCVEIDGENIYVDASGAQSKDLIEQRYISEAGAMQWMKFVDYFVY